MDFASQAKPFKPFLCRNRMDDHVEPPFAPIAYDIIVLNQDGALRIAENAPAGQMSGVLLRSNRNYAGICNDDEDVAALILIRFEEDENTRGTSPQPVDDWSRLWPLFDCCCNDDAGALDFASRLRQTDSHCHSSVSKNKKTDGTSVLECSKISYSFGCVDKHILLAHHFHEIDGKCKDMVRMMTYGLPRDKIEAIFSKALSFLRIRPSLDCDSEPPGGPVSPPQAPTPHPKAIICSMLECLEKQCSKDLKVDKIWVGKIEDDIDGQRDPNKRKPKALEINFVKLSETRIRLGEVREKLQYLLSSVESLERIEGLPRVCRRRAPMCKTQGVTNDTGGTNTTNEEQLSHQWWWQLREAETRLSGLKVKCKQHSINIENLQERVKGILCIVSILLAEKENEYSRQLDIIQEERSKYQVKMLEQQRLIAAGSKRDNTTLFSVPIFTWDKKSIIGPHFMIYWYFTGPITTTLVVGFSAWFAKTWWDDRMRERRERREGDAEDDPENGGLVGK